MVFGLCPLAAFMRPTQRNTAQPITRSPLSAKEFEDQLKSSPRAWSSQKSSTPSPLYLAEYENLQKLVITSKEVDGTWLCQRCNFENDLVHRFGPHPFARLQCGQCEHVFDKSDSSTEVLGRHVLEVFKEVDVPRFEDGNLVPYGMICPACGLSHRATEVKKKKSGRFGASRTSTVSFTGVTCQCRKQGSEGWFRFNIGKPDDWNGDSVKCYAKFLKQRLKRKTS